MHSSVIGKIEKANRYARELDRISIDGAGRRVDDDRDACVLCGREQGQAAGNVVLEVALWLPY